MANVNNSPIFKQLLQFFFHHKQMQNNAYGIGIEGTRRCLPSYDKLNRKYGEYLHCVCGVRSYVRQFWFNFLSGSFPYFLPYVVIWAERLSINAVDYTHIIDTMASRHIFYYLSGEKPFYHRTAQQNTKHTRTHTYLDLLSLFEAYLSLIFMGSLFLSRYGREDEEVMGLKFCNEAIIALKQIWPTTEDEGTITPLQVRLWPEKSIRLYAVRCSSHGNL